MSALQQSIIAFLRITFRLLRKGFPYFFQTDISNEALSCAHRIDDETGLIGGYMWHAGFPRDHETTTAGLSVLNGCFDKY